MIRVTFEIPDRNPKQDARFHSELQENHARVLNYVRESFLREIASTWIVEYVED